MAEPRLAPVPPERWDDETRAALLRYLRRPELYLSGAPDAPPMPKIFGLFANNLRLGEAWMAFSEVLAKETAVDTRLLELMILRVAWRTRSEYEWLQHARIGTQAGLTNEQLHAIPEGGDHAIWSPVERVLLEATDEIIDRQRVSDATWAGLAEHFDAAQLLEVLFVVGAYLCLAAVANSAGLQPDPPTEPIDAPPIPEIDP